MTSKQEHDRLTMPGQEPTDDDLRQDAELTRQELADTVAALGEKADVKGRVQKAAHEKAEELREKGDELTVKLQERGDEFVGKLPEPVATKVRPVVTKATRKPGIPLAGLLAFLVVLRLWLKRRNRSTG
jgi:hypothetical protein